MERIILHTNSESVRKMEEFKNASVEKQRFLVYANKMHTLHQVVKYESDEKLCYFYEEQKARMGVKGFVQRKATEGFTYDKKKKKLSIWYGKLILKISAQLMESMLTDLKKEWFLKMSPDIQRLCNRALLERIIKNRITNPRDFIKAYLKTSLRVKGVSPELYYQVLCNIHNYSDYGRLTAGRLNEILRYSKSPDWVLKNIATAAIFKSNLLTDIVQECMTLGIQFDWSWSTARIKDEHTKMTRKIREMNLEFISNTTISYDVMPELPKGWELITNEKRLFMEGSTQDHCVYNYWAQVANKSMFILSIIQPNGTRITASIAKHSYLESSVHTTDLQWRIGQIYGYKNDQGPADTRVIPEVKAEVVAWMMKPENQAFFERQGNPEVFVKVQGIIADVF